MLRHLNRDISGSLVDLSEFTPRLIVAQSKAEEGAVGSWTVTLDDPGSDLVILGHSNWFIEDDESEDEDDIIFGGFVGSTSFARYEGSDRRMQGPLARVVVVEILDANTFLSRQIMRGADTNRPAETDVERIEWILGTDEASIVTDASTYVDTSGPRNMDASPLRGTYFGQIITDCAQTSGKNFFAWYRKVSGIRTMTMWYGRDTLPDYVSPLFITNDPADLNNDAIDDGSATVWKLSEDAKLRRIHERQYCGCYLTYEGGAVYRHNADTHDLISAVSGHHRDMVTNAPMVKSQTKAQARADRQLLDVQDHEVRITTTLTGIPQERVTLAKAGMRLEVKGTHWGPDDDDWHYARILSAQPRPFGPGRTWDIDLELSMGAESDGPAPPDFTGTAFAGLQRSRGNDTDQTGPLKYANTYDIGGGGWNTAPTTGPLQIVAGVPNPELDGLVYDSIEILEPMDVRIYARAHVTGVYIPATTAVLNVYVNGSLEGTQTVGIGPGFAGGTVVEVDLRDFHVDAGDIVSIDSAGSGLGDAIFWTNNGVNDTYLKVGRGFTYDNFDLVFEGP